MERPSVQYATTAFGSRVAFAIQGEGTPVVLPPSTTWTLHPPRAIPVANDLWQLANDARVLAFNHVRVGLSQRTNFDFSLDGLVDELRTVVEAADVREFVLLASGCAGPPAIKYAVKYPDRIKHLILRETWASSAEPAQKRLMMFGAAIEGGDWETASQGYARLGWNLNGDEANAVAEGIRSAIEPQTLLAYFRCVAEHDVSHLLGDLSVPTTVMRRDDAFYPLQAGGAGYAGALEQAIPGAQLRLSDDPQWEWSSYSSFLDAASPNRVHETSSTGDSATNEGIHPDDVHLTEKEVEVLVLVAKGDSNREIASALGIAEGTVKRHVSNLLRKADLRNRRQLMRFADRRGHSG